MSDRVTSEPWRTKREIARRLRISTRTVERLHLPHTKVGGQNRYLESQVEAALSGAELADNVIPLRPRREEKTA